MRELNNISAIDLEPRKPRGHGSARGSHFAMTAIVPTEGIGRREAVMRTKKGAQWNRVHVAGPAPESRSAEGRLSFPQSRNNGAGGQRFDSGEPLHHGVEEEAHTEGKSRV